jgi:large subunit ribosomal protein L25
MTAKPDITLDAEVRRETGSRPAGRLRAAGKLPAVLYGKGMDPVQLSLDHHDVRVALQDRTARESELTLNVGGTAHRVKVQSIQRDPVRNTAVHIDFLAV